jgi:hypothetical protein
MNSLVRVASVVSEKLSRQQVLSIMEQFAEFKITGSCPIFVDIGIYEIFLIIHNHKSTTNQHLLNREQETRYDDVSTSLQIDAVVDSGLS